MSKKNKVKLNISDEDMVRLVHAGVFSLHLTKKGEKILRKYLDRGVAEEGVKDANKKLDRLARPKETYDQYLRNYEIGDGRVGCMRGWDEE